MLVQPDGSFEPRRPTSSNRNLWRLKSFQWVSSSAAVPNSFIYLDFCFRLFLFSEFYRSFSFWQARVIISPRSTGCDRSAKESEFYQRIQRKTGLQRLSGAQTGHAVTDHLNFRPRKYRHSSESFENIRDELHAGLCGSNLARGAEPQARTGAQGTSTRKVKPRMPGMAIRVSADIDFRKLTRREPAPADASPSQTGRAQAARP